MLWKLNIFVVLKKSYGISFAFQNFLGNNWGVPSTNWVLPGFSFLKSRFFIFSNNFLRAFFAKLYWFYRFQPLYWRLLLQFRLQYKRRSNRKRRYVLLTDLLGPRLWQLSLRVIHFELLWYRLINRTSLRQRWLQRIHVFNRALWIISVTLSAMYRVPFNWLFLLNHDFTHNIINISRIKVHIFLIPWHLIL